MIFSVEENASLQCFFLVHLFEFIGAFFESDGVCAVEERKGLAIRISSGAKAIEGLLEEPEYVIGVGA